MKTDRRTVKAARDALLDMGKVMADYSDAQARRDSGDEDAIQRFARQYDYAIDEYGDVSDDLNSRFSTWVDNFAKKLDVSFDDALTIFQEASDVAMSHGRHNKGVLTEKQKLNVIGPLKTYLTARGVLDE